MEDLHRLAKERELEKLETAWMARLEDERPGYEELLSVGGYVARRVDADMAEALLWTLVTTASEALQPEEALPLARRAAEALPENRTLREELAKLYIRRFGDVAAMPHLVKLCGLAGGEPLARACGRLEELARMRPGGYVCLRRSRRIGRIESFDVEEGRVVFHDEDGERAMGFDLALEELETIPPDDLRALSVFERDRLREMAENDPVGLVKLALTQAKGQRLDLRDLKAKLTAAAVEPKRWSAWWNKAKPRLRRAPFIRMSSANQPTLTLRGVAVTYGDELLDRFDRAPDAAAAVKVALEFARDPASAGDRAGDVGDRIEQGLLDRAAASKSDALLLGATLDMLGDMRGDEEAQSRAAAMVAEIEDLPGQIAALVDERVARRAVALVRRALPEAWADAFEAALPRGPMKRCEMLARELKGDSPERLQRVAEGIVAGFDDSPEAFIWLWRAVCDKRNLGISGIDPGAITLSLLVLAQRLGRTRAGEEGDEAKRLRRVLQATLAVNNLASVARVFREVDEETARRMWRNLQSNRGIRDDILNGLVKTLQSSHPELFEEQLEPWEDESVIWTTQAGLDGGQARYDHLVNVEVPENQRALGRAIEFGDLSENAEYTAAREEQARLAEREARMKADLAMARVIPPATKPAERVTVGSRVRALNLTAGREETLTFLGPWDLNLETRALSYKAPLSQAFMGRRVGDEVSAGEGDGAQTYRILSVENAV